MFRVHADELYREGITDKFLLDGNGTLNNLVNKEGRSWEVEVIAVEMAKKSQCRPSSWLMHSFAKHSPGMRPHFFSQ